MLGADGALTDIICYVCINARPVSCLSCLCLHLLHPLVGSIQVIEGTVKVFWGNADMASLEEEPSLYGQLVPSTLEVFSDPRDLLPVIWPSPKG